MPRAATFAAVLGMSFLSMALTLAQESAPVPAQKKIVEQPKKPLLSPDIYQYAGLPPKTAAEVMTVPAGFTVKLFAGEPDVRQPIAFCIDDRGRLWVAEAYSYPMRRPDKEAKDRIVIFEDTDGDGVFDKKTVFMEGLNLVSGIEVGFGGVWIGAAPYLMFVPVNPGEDKPAGKPQILLDGWGYQDTHETLNSFTWGPDGWLYGCHGVFTHSQVGKPGTPDKDRTPLNAGVWRYHPTRHTFEVFAHGTSNPWGLDFDEHGQAFIEACVIPHNWHIIQGARYFRQGGQHFNPYTYADIQTIAEHSHFLGNNPWDANGKSDSVGGGHAHAGAMIYQGGTWPKEYWGKMFMGNIHGHRLNVDVLTPKGSGFVASRAPDFLLSHDSWAMFVNLQTGPDGNVYVIDWYDQQSCHSNNPQIWDRSNGRIYKIVHKDAKPVVGIDLAKLSDKELVDLQLHANAWYARHARRILQERVAGNEFDPIRANRVNAIIGLLKPLLGHPDAVFRLRGYWVNHAVQPRSFIGYHDPDPFVSAWMNQISLERGVPVYSMVPVGKLGDVQNQGIVYSALGLLEYLAKNDASPVVRLGIASAAQRLPVNDRWGVLASLVAHGEDASDHNLPLMYWYAAEPLAEKDPAKALDLALAAKMPPLPQFMVRRISSAATPEALALVMERLAAVKDENLHLAILRGLKDGLKGRRNLAMPAGWSKAYALLADSKNAEVRSSATALAATFGDAKAFTTLRELLASSKADASSRQDALATLLAARDKQLVPILQNLLSDPNLRGLALQALATYDDPKTPQLVLAVYPTLDTNLKRDALNTLASRVPYGKAMLEAIADKKIAANEVSADIIRQLRNLSDKALSNRITEVWGSVRATPAEKTKQIAEWRKFLSAQVKTDVSLGRAVFAKTCQQCHTLFGTGGTVGPDITGANRGNLDYLLENIIDPSAVIPKEFASTVIELKNGRFITGIVRSETPAALTVVTANETLTLPRDDIHAAKASDVSMMPDDLLKPLAKEEVRALVAYLQSPKQVPILATADNAKDFFNGKDLTGWTGDAKLWSVENGEIVGKSPGLKRNMWLVSHMQANDFKLTLKVKLVPNSANSGVQFHSEVLPSGGMRGPQADIGVGFWGTLYEEEARGQLWKEIGDKHVKVNDWNDYVIEATGSKVKTWLNGKLCVDLDDPKLSRQGVFALQLHSGEALEVRFKELRLEVPR